MKSFTHTEEIAYNVSVFFNYRKLFPTEYNAYENRHAS